jgi:type VII secretion integral membrane protein EccD
VDNPRGQAVATGTTVFSRVTVVAPRTRIDVALPADVSVADLLPMLLEMAKETTSDGGARHGGWCLAKLGDSPLDPSRTLGALGVVDGDMLQLRKRSENPPPPLYDDVVDAIAEAAPDSYRPWTKATANRIGHIAGALALVIGALAVLMAGPLFGAW